MGNITHINKDSHATFNNNAFFCIGTGRMGLALQKAYCEQLKLVQDKIGFTHIRGHGLFCEDMSIYHEYKDADGTAHVEYNFTYLDMVMDNYREVHITPFLELGFMPKQLASGEQAVFYWQGNVTPPADYSKWAALVKATLSHLIARYGKEEVTTWPIEVWNEPNLGCFWKDADMKEYFKLYDVTSRAVKEVSADFKVGGPAVCGGTDKEWVQAFLEFVRDNKSPLDFVTRHHYTISQPEHDGHYGYAQLHTVDHALEQLEPTRGIVDSFPEFRGKDIHVTEFNTAYVGNIPLHDTNLNAAYIAYLLSRLGDNHASYSYWTFGDIFEEGGVPFTPFHGGFGLVADGCIPKPTFWTFAFFKKLNGTPVFRSENSVIVRRADGSYCGVCWNLDDTHAGKNLALSFAFDADSAADKTYCLTTRLVDESCCNPLKAWHDLGEPASLSEAQKQLLQEAAQPKVSTTRIAAGKDSSSANESVKVNLELLPNAVCCFELTSAPLTSDRGYSYERVMALGSNKE